MKISEKYIKLKTLFHYAESKKIGWAEREIM